MMPPANAEYLQQRSINYLDAPVSGGTKGAEAASLAIMVGGNEKTFEKSLSVLSAMGRAVVVGPVGSGQLAKLCNQAITAVAIGVVAEAVLLMKTAGADPPARRAGWRLCRFNHPSTTWSAHDPGQF